jgi:hypothetical protein
MDPLRARSEQGPVDHVAQSRVDPRIGADFAVEVVCHDLPAPLVGRTRDLGIGGVCLATPSVFSCRSVRRVVLRLPDGRMVLDARGLWQKPEHGESAILTGLAFVSPSEEAVGRLWNVVLDGGKELARFLYGDSDLAKLSVDEAVGLAHASRWRNVPTGRYIYRGDAKQSGTASIFVVHTGAVALQLRVRGAIDHTIERLGPGRLFGGLPLIAEGLPSESALAATDVRLLEIHEGAFRYLCAAKPWLAQRLAEAVTQTYARRAGALLARLGNAL